MTTEITPVVAAICERVDRLPLAIELAAGRLHLFEPDALLTRLERRLPLLAGGPRDLPPRQQTLRATIAWSYDLLDAAEQALFSRLAVCVSGCSLDAAQALCGGALDGVESLVKKSLLLHETGVGGEPRLRMLETIREYALERLEENGLAFEARRAHALYFRALAERAEGDYFGSTSASGSTSSSGSTPISAPPSSGRSRAARPRLGWHSPAPCGVSCITATT